MGTSAGSRYHLSLLQDRSDTWIRKEYFCCCLKFSVNPHAQVECEKYLPFAQKYSKTDTAVSNQAKKLLQNVLCS